MARVARVKAQGKEGFYFITCRAAGLESECPFDVKPFRRKVYHDVSFKVDGICRARFLADDEAFLMKGTFHGKDVLVIEDFMQAADGIRVGLRPAA